MSTGRLKTLGVFFILRQRHRQTSESILDQRTGFLALLKGFFREAPVDQDGRDPQLLGEVREVRPDFRLHQQAEVRLSSFQKLFDCPRRVVRQITLSNSVSEFLGEFSPDLTPRRRHMRIKNFGVGPAFKDRLDQRKCGSGLSDGNRMYPNPGSSFSSRRIVSRPESLGPMLQVLRLFSRTLIQIEHGCRRRGVKQTTVNRTGKNHSITFS